ncbi:MAG TPA: DUF3105 domain-containing protein [Actinomycetota bacterium]|nr:DUF3105 domain-containing protein [Actinomycetota bacterium]
MTNKNKKRRSPQATAPPKPRPAAAGNDARRERKEQARQARAAQRKRAERSAFVRRTAVFAVAGVVGVGAFYWLTRAASPRDIPAAAVAAAEAAGCTEVQQPVGDAQAGQHVADGTPITYAQKPATSGEHYGGQVLPSSPETYDQPIGSEPAAVHFLEHSGVMLYFRAEGNEALSPEVADALKGVATDRSMTVAAPYEGLPDGTSVALAAWDQLQTCPGTITAEQATTIADGFARAFACTSNAPEANAADDC